MNFLKIYEPYTDKMVYLNSYTYSICLNDAIDFDLYNPQSEMVFRKNKPHNIIFNIYIVYYNIIHTICCTYYGNNYPSCIKNIDIFRLARLAS